MQQSAKPIQAEQRETSEGIYSAPATEAGSQSGSEDLQRREAALYAVFDANPHAMLVYNARGEVVRANRAAIDMLEYGPAAQPLAVPYQAQLIRMLSSDGVPLSPSVSPILRALRGEATSGSLAILERRDGNRRWLAISAAPLYDNGAVSGAVVSFADVSAQQEAREQKEDLLRAVSHDLRNPLAALRMHTHVLQSKMGVMDDAGELLAHTDAILASSSAMEGMIKSMVDAARLEGGQLRLEPKTLAIRSFISTVLRQQDPGLSAGRISLTPGEEMLVVADELCLERILANLLSNAIKYSAADAGIDITITRQAGVVVVSVSDHGRGLAPEDLRCLFRRYFRAANCGEEQGLGLGLYVTQMLVAAQGGRIWAESVLGEGSTFSFTLPAYQQ